MWIVFTDRRKPILPSVTAACACQFNFIISFVQICGHPDVHVGHMFQKHVIVLILLLPWALKNYMQHERVKQAAVGAQQGVGATQRSQWKPTWWWWWWWWTGKASIFLQYEIMNMKLNEFKDDKRTRYNSKYLHSNIYLDLHNTKYPVVPITSIFFLKDYSHKD